MLNGTFASTVWPRIITNFTLKAGTYTLSGTPQGAPEGCYIYDDNTFGGWTDRGSGSTKTFENDTTGSIVIRVPNGTYNNVKFYPMIEVGSQKTTFAPYSNECPILGWDEVDVTRTGNSNILNPAMVNKTSNSLWKWYDTEGYRLKANTKYSLTNFTTETNIQMYIKDLATDNALVSSNNFASYTPTSDIMVYFQAYRGDGIADSSLFQLEIGDRTSYHAYNGQTYTIDLGETHYGGEVDVVSGVLTVDRAYVDLGTLSWALENGIFRLNESIGAKLTSDTSAVAKMLCSVYKTVSQNAMGSTTTDQCIAGLNWSNGVRVKDSNYTTVADFKTAMNGVQLVYELATPLTIQLTPTAVKSLLGSNNVWADTGDIKDCVYRRDMNTTINDIIARIEALEG